MSLVSYSNTQTNCAGVCWQYSPAVQLDCCCSTPGSPHLSGSPVQQRRVSKTSCSHFCTRLCRRLSTCGLCGVSPARCVLRVNFRSCGFLLKMWTKTRVVEGLLEDWPWPACHLSSVANHKPSKTLNSYPRIEHSPEILPMDVV
jgi:hypothetical protein